MPDLLNKLSFKKYYLYILLAVGIILIFLSYIMPKSQTTVKDGFSEADYISDLEEKVADIVSTIDGAGKSKVMISISSTTESVYVKENKTSYDNDDGKSKGDSENNVLTMTDSSGNEFALMTKQIMPKISGVTVVCDGGNNALVQNNVINAVSTLLDIGTNKVCVIAKAK